MTRRRLPLVLLGLGLFLCALLVACDTSLGSGQAPANVPAGRWAGQTLTLLVTSPDSKLYMQYFTDGVTLHEGSAPIPGPLALDGTGQFDIPLAWSEARYGDYPTPTLDVLHMQTPLPATATPLPARLQGRLHGQTLELSIILAGNELHHDTLTLQP